MTRLPHFLSIAIALCAGACTADVYGPSTGEEHALIELEIPVEGFIDEAVWRHAPDGCEGRLVEDVDIGRLARAENGPGLVVVIDEEGDALCVDTIESIAIELERVSGDPSPDPMMPKMLR